jgi:hypothetical protein
MSKLYLGSTEVTLPGGGGGGGPEGPTLPSFKGVGYGTGTTIASASATPHAMGAWAQLNSYCDDGDMMVLHPAVGTNGVATDALVDIAVGASGAEVPFITGLAVGGIQSPWPIIIPRIFAAGDRVAVRGQCVTASRGLNFNPYFYPDFPAEVASSDGTLDVLTTFPATSRAVSVASSSGWVEVAASTSRAYKSTIIVPSVLGLTNPTNNSTIRIGMGAPGSEVTLVEFTINTSNTESVWTTTAQSHPLLCANSGPVPAGSRLAVSTTSSNSMGLCLIGVPA